MSFPHTDFLWLKESAVIIINHHYHYYRLYRLDVTISFSVYFRFSTLQVNKLFSGQFDYKHPHGDHIDQFQLSADISVRAGVSYIGYNAPGAGPLYIISCNETCRAICLITRGRWRQLNCTSKMIRHRLRLVFSTTTYYNA